MILNHSSLSLCFCLPPPKRSLLVDGHVQRNLDAGQYALPWDSVFARYLLQHVLTLDECVRCVCVCVCCYADICVLLHEACMRHEGPHHELSEE